MAKTITLRLSDDVYTMFKTAANGTHRTMSNFLEFAALSYLSVDAFVADSEMKKITDDKKLIESLKLGEKEINEGKFKLFNRLKNRRS